MRNCARLIATVCLAVVLLSLAPIPSLAQEVTVIASGPWKGQGRIARTAPEQGVYWGYLEGIIFLQGGTGVFDNAKFVCPATFDIDLITGAQKGEGRCVLTAGTGDHAQARWTCAGVHASGCRGKFTFTSGTGKLQGITGESEFVVRSALAGITVSKTEDIASESSVGLIYWPALRYRVP